jgi:hypothetical protein
MKKLSTLIGVAGVLFATNLYASLTVTLTEVGGAGGNANGGGLFQAATSANGTFDTFCISIVTTFSPGTQYSYDISPTIGAYGIPSASSYIAAGTAYLYQQFSLRNPNYYAGVNGVNNANAVQAAIWLFQGDLSGTDGTYDSEDSTDLGSLLAPILTDVETATHMTLAQLKENGNGAYGVEALNLYTGTPSSYNQPQLVIVPEPTTMIAGALLLLPFGASTLRILRKRQTA